MRLIESFKKRKLVLLNIFLTLYISINLIGGERGLVSYFEKKQTYQSLVEKEIIYSKEIKDLKHKIKLITSNDLDYFIYIFLFYLDFLI